ncbi:hypothetical protein ACHWQZ_G005990 [Mnemiopsis leidyi]
MLIFLLLLYSMLEGSHTLRNKGRQRNNNDHNRDSVVGQRRRGPSVVHHRGSFLDELLNEGPTPTSTPTVTHERNAGKCSENSCKMGECRQVADGIRMCICMRGYVGHRCSELMVNLADYVEAHPETKRKIKIIAEKEGQGGAARVTSAINQRMYHWSKKQMKKDEFAKKRAKKRQRENSEKVRNHQIVHSAFQIAFRDQILDDNSNSVDLPKKEQNRGKSREAVERRGRSRSGRSRRDLSAQLVDPQSHFYTDPSEAAPHLVLCIEDCQTVLSYSSELCPDNKLAVELRIEESDWHHVPVNRVKCCKALVSDTCQERSQPVLTV